MYNAMHCKFTVVLQWFYNVIFRNFSRRLRCRRVVHKEFRAAAIRLLSTQKIGGGRSWRKCSFPIRKTRCALLIFFFWKSSFSIRKSSIGWFWNREWAKKVTKLRIYDKIVGSSRRCCGPTPAGVGPQHRLWICIAAGSGTSHRRRSNGSSPGYMRKCSA